MGREVNRTKLHGTLSDAFGSGSKSSRIKQPSERRKSADDRSSALEEKQSFCCCC